LPFTWRFNNAVVSYVAYIWQMFWPVRLAAFYPHPNDQLALWQVLLAIAFLIAITLLAIHWRKERPYVFTGWFWYVGMLVPVIGLVQAGEQARADRYTYLPQIGLYVVIAWGIPDLILSITRRERNRSRGYALLCAATSAMIVILLSWRAFVQTSYWKNSEVLWNHALAVTGDNDVAHNNLGYLFLQRRELDSARSHFETALKIRARTAAPYYNFGGALIENSLAAILAQRGLINESISHYDKAISMRPDYGDPYLNLGTFCFSRAESTMRWPNGRRRLGHSHTTRLFMPCWATRFYKQDHRRLRSRSTSVQREISAQDPLGRNNLAWLLATSPDASIRDGNRAIELAKEAVRLSRGKDPNYLRTLAAAFAEAGHFGEAEETARQALQAAERRSNSTLANALQDEIALYELGLPYHK
jgi:Tfp pilus assembly protein PilF